MEKNEITAKPEAIFIGGSAGSLDVILQILVAFEGKLSVPVIIILHRKPGTDFLLADLIKAKTNLFVKEAEEKETITPGTIYMAPADYHLLIEEDKTFSFDASEKINYSRPSIDVTFMEAARVYGQSAACILLSGASRDGTDGLKAVKEAGGLTIVQHPDSAEIAYMPEIALKNVQVDRVFTLAEINKMVAELS